MSVMDIQNSDCISCCDDQCFSQSCEADDYPTQSETSLLNASLTRSSLLESFKAKPREKCGYSCEFVDPPPTLLQSECSICLQILCQPHLISCCGHNYCKMCIEQVMEKSRPCPLCNEEGFTVLHNKGLQRSLNELTVYCSNVKLGCDWKGPLGQFDQHLNEDPPEPEYQLLGCLLVEVECRHGCGSRMKRGAMAKHQNEQCPQRPFCCAYCREYDSIHADVVYRHWPVCAKYPMTCPNRCTVYAIERENMESHLQHDCPLQKVSCEFSFAGCEVEIPREELPSHLESNQVEHMSMLAAANVRLNDDLAEKDDQIARQSEELGDKLMEERARNQKEVESLRRENKELKREIEELKSNMSVLMSTFKVAIEQLKDSQTKQERHTIEYNESLRMKITNLNSKCTAAKDELTKQCYSIQSHVGLFPVEFVMMDFKSHCDQGRDWESPPFYSHLEGYRFCLVVTPRGVVDAEGSYISVYACLVQGEYDDRLKWPFRGAITIQLLNQLSTDRIPATGTIRFTDNTPNRFTSRVLGEGGAKKGWGILKFIRHEELAYNGVKNRQFLKDDSLRFRVTKVDHLTAIV